MAQLEESTRRLSLRRSHGRVINAVAELLRDRLEVPEIYIKPRIPGASGIDVLAADRAGSGDLHGVEVKVLMIFPTRTQIKELTTPLKAQPFHFKYLALPGFSANLSDDSRFKDLPELFEDTGIGRFGIISFDHRLLNPDSIVGPHSAALTLPPERFVVRGEKLAGIERFLSRATPDMRVRI
jgi:hypothetical protein